MQKPRGIIWLCREHSPLLLLLYLMFTWDDTPMERLLEGELQARDSVSLTYAAGILAHGPLWMCDVPEEGALLRAICSLVAGDRTPADRRRVPK